MGKPIKVFGIGLNRTGTSTLKLALRWIGYRHCRRQRRLVNHFFSGEFAPIIAETSLYDSFDDWPWPLMYRALYAEYGDRARFILTKRSSPEVWVNSLKSHAETTPNHGTRKRVYGHAYPHGHEAVHIALYENHINEARAFFKSVDAEHLLHEVCWEDGDSWPELCKAIGEPVPDMDFPHANSQNTASADPEVLAKNAEMIAAQLKRLR